MQGNPLTRISLALGALIVVGLVAAFYSTSDHPRLGVGGEDGVLGGDFTLTSISGDVSLSDYRGKVVVMYFGFLNCPKVCPASMGVMQQTMHKLDSDSLAQVQGLLVSIDPKRDTAEDLDNFTRKIHSNIIGLTGSEEAIDAIAKDYGAYFKITEAENPDADDYAFRHSSRYYLIDQNGKLVDAMRHSTTANELVARLETLIQRS